MNQSPRARAPLCLFRHGCGVRLKADIGVVGFAQGNSFCHANCGCLFYPYRDRHFASSARAASMCPSTPTDKPYAFHRMRATLACSNCPRMSICIRQFLSANGLWSKQRQYKEWPWIGWILPIGFPPYAILHDFSDNKGIRANNVLTRT